MCPARSVVEHVAPAPTVTFAYAALAPVVEYLAPALTMVYAAQVTTMTAAPTVGWQVVHRDDGAESQTECATTLRTPVGDRVVQNECCHRTVFPLIRHGGRLLPSKTSTTIRSWLDLVNEVRQLG